MGLLFHQSLISNYRYGAWQAVLVSYGIAQQPHTVRYQPTKWG